MRILVIDRQALACEKNMVLLDAWKRFIRLGEAATACEALHLLEGYLPQAILSDIRMPGRSGLESIRLIRGKYAQIKIIVLSLALDLKAEALAVGADAFVCKSDPPDELRKTLLSVLR